VAAEGLVKKNASGTSTVFVSVRSSYISFTVCFSPKRSVTHAPGVGIDTASGGLSHLLLVRILDTSKKAGVHYHLVMLSPFLQPLRSGSRFCLFFVSCSSLLGTIFRSFRHLATPCLQDPPLLRPELSFFILEKEHTLNASAINHEKSLVYTCFGVGTQLN
jgi:hypothetical protein